MTFDTLTMTAVAGELQKLAGARVQRVIQPTREEVVLSLYHEGAEHFLLLSAHPQHARVHLTRQRFRSPEQPPPFCMLLRKYLTGAQIRALSQPHLERILILHFAEHEGLPAVRLIAEIMGRRSNIVLVNDMGIILGAIKTAGPEQNPRRPVLPGLPYAEVPPQRKLDPTAVEGGVLAKAMLPLLAQGTGPEEALLKAVGGISPLAAREALHRSGWDDEAPVGSIERLSRELKELFRSCGAEGAFLVPELNIDAPYPLTHLRSAARQRFAQMNELLDCFYKKLGREEEREKLRRELRSRVNRRKSRLEEKLSELQKELQQAVEADRYRLYGETLLTYGAMVERGAAEATLPHLYKPEESITIPLDPALNAAANAREYFRRYRKASSGRKHLEEQISRIHDELAYCRELLYAIEEGDLSSLEEIREELVESGYIQPRAKESRRRQKQKQRQEKPRPLSFKASSGSTILVGLNNRQNDYLTFKLASSRDTWLHAQGLPGSHVIVKSAGGAITEGDIEEAALLAAYYSRGRELPAVAVDYTEVRHLRRHPAGRPGLVLYNRYQTVTVNPRDEKLKRLLRRHIPE